MRVLQSCDILITKSRILSYNNFKQAAVADVVL